MKIVVAVIQPTKLKAVQEALAKVEVERMTVFDSQGYARQRGHAEMFRGAEYKIQLLRKVTLEIAVNDDFLERTIDAITSAARSGPTGNIGDGKIFVLPLDECLQIGGDARGPEAV